MIESCTYDSNVLLPSFHDVQQPRMSMHVPPVPWDCRQRSRPAMASSWMGMSTVLLEGVSRRWVRSGTFTRCQCLNGTYKMMRVRRKIVFHPSSIHPSGNRKEGRKEETHSRDVFPHFPRASDGASVGCAGGAPAKAKAPCVTNGWERGEG